MINFKTFEAGIRIAPNSAFAADPVTGKIGQIYWNTTRQILRICTNDAPTTWQDLYINPSPVNDATLRWDTSNDRWDYNPDLLISSSTVYAADNTDADTVDANNLTLRAASKTAGTALGGDVIIQPGTGTTGNGKTVLNGDRIFIGAQSAADPSSSAEGDFYYNTSNRKIRYYDSTAWVEITTNTGVQTLTNKTIGDTNTINAQDDAFAIQDATDNSIQLLFDAAGTTSTSTTILSSQTVDRFLTLPDITDTLVTKNTVDILNNKTIGDSNIINAQDDAFTIQDAIDNTIQVLIDAAGSAGTSTTLLSSQTTNKILTLPDITDTLVTKNTVDILTNKTIGDTNTINAQDDAFTVQDATDNTIQVLIDAAGVTGTSTTILSSQTINRTLTLPDATDTLVGRDTTDTLTNKTIGDTNTIAAQDDAFVIQNAGTNTIQMLFDVEGTASTSTTILSSQTVDRILTLPDATDTLVGRDTTDALTNKSIDADNNTITNIDNDEIKALAAIEVSKLEALTADRAVQTNATTGFIEPSNVNNTQLDKLRTQGNDAAGELVVTNATQTLSNKTISGLKYDEANVVLATSIVKNAATVMHLTGTPTDLETMTGGVDGEVRILVNETGDGISIVNDIGANGFHTGTGADIRVEDNGSVQVLYEDSESRWRVIGGSGGGTGNIKVDLYDPVSTSLPTGATATIDGQSLVDGDKVLFSNLSSNNNRIYEASGVGASISWEVLNLFELNLETPSDGDLVIIKRGDAFADQKALFNGTDFRINDTVRYFDGANGVDYWEQSSIKTSTLTDNTTNGIVFDVNVTGSENWIVEYSLSRGSGVKETGQLYITSDGSSVAITKTNSFLGASGVDFNADINTGNIRLLYTTTSTGSDATMKYFTKRWSNTVGGPGGVPNYSGFTGSTVPAAGAPGEVQFHGATGNLDTTSQFKWDSIEEAIDLDGLKIHKLQGPNILLDNQSAPQPVISVNSASYRHTVIEYSLSRNGSFRTGRMLLTNDGVSQALLVDDFVEVLSTGIVFTSDIAGSNVRILYTSTSTGSNASFKFNIRNWT